MQLKRIGESLARRFVLSPYGPDAEADPASFDADAFIETAVRDLARAGVDAVISSSDYPGCLVAAIIAEQLGLPGADPESLLRASHKYYSRQSQAVSVPGSTPGFALLDPQRLESADIELDFPLFVKPVKSWFSQHARRIESFAELATFVTSPGVRSHLAEFVRPFNQLLGRYTSFRYDACWMIAEELLEGHQVTYEGYVVGGVATAIGIVDSIMYPETSSFERFMYPSRIDSATAARMDVMAERIVNGLGLTHGLFNIEFIHNPQSGSIHVVEVNPRMCGQFADLMHSVNGVNTYEILIEVGLGHSPAVLSAKPEFDAAASFALRQFGDGIVAATPSKSQIARLMERAAVTLVTLYYGAGQRLSSNTKQFDGWSYRYAVVNLCGSNEGDLLTSLESVKRELAVRIIDVNTSSGSSSSCS